IFEAGKAPIGADPEPPLRVFIERIDNLVCQTRIASIIDKLPVFIAVQAVVCAGPEISCTIFKKKQYAVAFDLGNVAMVEDGETDAVKTGKPFVSAEPEIAVTGLNYRKNAVLRQFIIPYFMPVLSNGLMRIKGKNKIGAGENNRKKAQNYYCALFLLH